MKENQFESDVNDWFERELALFDPSLDEAETLRREFVERERGKWTIVTWRKYMDDSYRSNEIRTLSMIDSVTIHVIPHSHQRYQTAGDWQIRDNKLYIDISDTGNWRSNMLVALHELTEALLCTDDLVTQEQVDKFDLAYSGDSEPGDEVDAPYRDQHCFATAVERMVCAAMRMAWKEHDERVEAL